MNQKKKSSPKRNRQFWLVPAVILLIIAVTSVGYYVFNQLYALNGNPAQTTESKQTTTQESTVDPKFAEIKEKLERETIYEGIFVNEQALGGLTREAASTLLNVEESKLRDSFKVEISAGGEKFLLTAEEAGLTFDTQSVLQTAYETGRTSKAATEADQLNERYAIVQGLEQKPLELKIKSKIDPEKVKQAITAWADTKTVPAVNARATSFSASEKKFKFSAEKAGTKVNTTTVIEEALKQLNLGALQFSGEAEIESLKPAITVASMQGNIGLVSTAKTLAGSESSRGRDQNISKIVQKLNGLVLQPGETFSFNGTFGQRTAAKGFTTAGGIRDGMLVQELGGGICQPNTTLYQAVLKADLAIISRRPHSWPSAYTKIGLDATVSWPGPDFKFQNNTKYPIAIAASFAKPNVVVSVYGRQLEAGVTIDLISEHNGYIKEAAPIERKNPELAAGKRVEVRKPRTGQKATSYKIWKKNGTVIKKELVEVSTYRPIQGIYEIGTGAPAPTQPTSTTIGSSTTNTTTKKSAVTTTDATTTENTTEATTDSAAGTTNATTSTEATAGET
ncbi:MAG: VanW family protein [Saccharofermentanales bacterium]